MKNYGLLLNQIKSIVKSDLPFVSNLANTSAILFKMKDVNWAGFYLFDGFKLTLGPVQGEVGCTTIPIGKGVCGTSARARKTIVVDDVHHFDGHIACSTISKSEIVVPLLKEEKLVGVMDIDSPSYSRFKKEEVEFLEEVAQELMKVYQ